MAILVILLEGACELQTPRKHPERALAKRSTSLRRKISVPLHPYLCLCLYRLSLYLRTYICSCIYIYICIFIYIHICVGLEAWTWPLRFTLFLHEVDKKTMPFPNISKEQTPKTPTKAMQAFRTAKTRNSMTLLGRPACPHGPDSWLAG